MTPSKPSTPPRPIRFRVIDSPIGPLTLAGTDRALTHICMQDQAHPPADQADWIEDPAGFGDVIAQLEAYFAGELTEFDIVLDLEGTEFQKRVWAELLTIPYGQTRSYGEMARNLGKPGASRAVGLANGRNPVSIIVPCHRVIGADGSLTGYGGGLDRKTHLLDLEQRRGQLPLG
ncbi:MAG: methylated-DNA--[protein]-cysteine S-methyltransferase [Microthrixaceae bacterium]|nr:methylated-DNA--[protein]-cysteine S-methyltransferase [Microthrixaceae bacterium]